MSSLDTLYSNQAQNEIDYTERTLNARIEAINKDLQTAFEAAGVAEETEIESLKRRLKEAIETGDTETQKQLEDEIKRLEITKEFETKKKDAREEAEKEIAQTEYKAALSSYKIQIAQAVASAAQAILSIWARWAANPIVAGLLTAGAFVTTGDQIAAIREAKPQPPEFATGGLVYPSSGVGGGNRIIIPHTSTPQFQTGGLVIPSGGSGSIVNVAENGYPELMFNGGPSGEAFLNDFAQRMARYAGGSRSSGGRFDLVLQLDGRKIAEASADYYNNGKVRLKT
jgi:hypothetical protein